MGVRNNSEFVHEPIQYAVEEAGHLSIGGLDLRFRAERLDDEIDRTVMEMQAESVRKHGGPGSVHHAFAPRNEASSRGQGDPPDQAS